MPQRSDVFVCVSPFSFCDVLSGLHYVVPIGGEIILVEQLTHYRSWVASYNNTKRIILSNRCLTAYFKPKKYIKKIRISPYAYWYRLVFMEK